MGQIKFVSSIVLIALFAIAIIGYAVHFGLENNSAVKISDDDSFSSVSSQIQGRLGQTANEINASSGGFFSSGSQIDIQSDTTITGSTFKLGFSTMVGSIGAVFSLIKLKILGGDSGFGFFITMLGVVLTIMGIVYIWKTWKGGNPD